MVNGKGTALLELKKVSKVYTAEGNSAVGLNQVSAAFSKGEFVAVTGESGAGKSTLLHVLGGMDSYEEGELYIEGQPTSHYIAREWEQYRKRYVSFVFQASGLLDGLTVRDNVAMEFPEPEKADSRIREILETVGMEAFANRKAGNLSGGQRQRVAIARAIAGNAPVLLADEPTGNLDAENAKGIAELLKRISSDRLIIVVTHNLPEFEPFVTRVLRVRDGSIAEDRLTENRGSVSGEGPEKPPFPENTGIGSREKGSISGDASGEGPEEAAPNPETVETLGAAGAETADCGNPKAVNAPEKRIGPSRKAEIRKGLWLGRKLIGANLSGTVYAAAVTVLAGLLLQLLTGLFGMVIYRNVNASDRVFRENENRVVVSSRDGSVISEDSISLPETLSADKCSIVTNDILLDAAGLRSWKQYLADPQAYELMPFDPEFQIPFFITNEWSGGETSPAIGRLPEAENECALYIPYALRNIFGNTEILQSSIRQYGITYEIVGISYYTDNTRQGEMVLNGDGYRLAACASAAYGKLTAVYETKSEDGTVTRVSVTPEFSFAVGANRVYLRLDNNEAEVTEVAFRIDNGTDEEKEPEETEEEPEETAEEKSEEAGDQEEAGEDDENEGSRLTLGSDHIVLDGEETSLYENGTVLVNPELLYNNLEDFRNPETTQISVIADSGEWAERIREEYEERGFLAVRTDLKVRLTDGGLAGSVLLLLLPVLFSVGVFFLVVLLVRIGTGRFLEGCFRDSVLIELAGLGRRTARTGFLSRLILPAVCSVAAGILFRIFAYRISFVDRFVLYLPLAAELCVLLAAALVIRLSARKKLKELESTSLIAAVNSEK